MNWVQEAKEMFSKFYSRAVVLNDIKDMKLCKETLDILNEIEAEDEGNSPKTIDRDFRFVDGSSETGRGRTRDAVENITNVELEDMRLLPKKTVRYRWSDKPGEDNVGNADSNGSGKAG